MGIIGCGGTACGKHMASLAKLDSVEMVAFCDNVKEKAEKAAKEFGKGEARVHTDYKIRWLRRAKAGMSLLSNTTGIPSPTA